jgi:hypothetical protein
VFGSVSYPQFVYTCGSTTCSGAPSSGTVSIFNNLGAGTFKVVLLPRNLFTTLAVSANFSVRSTCSPTAPTHPAPTTPTRPTTPTKPVSYPVPSPVARPVVNPINLTAAHQALAQIDAKVALLVEKDVTLLPQFLNMAFHDCHVKCDGKRMDETFL